MALHPQTRFPIPKHRRKGDYPFCQHEQHSDSFRGTGRHSENPQVHLQRSVGQPVGSAKPPGSQWKPATALQSMASSPFPRGVAQLPGPLQMHRGCTRQGAIWLGFRVSWVWPTGTLAGAGGRTAVTRVCKKQTLSEHVSTLLPPMLGVNFFCLRHTLGL